ncbi:hypothetical protein [Facilibium subflavum]|uniref:hypothetical protein n=1 Tax=Facilibium subflavum TaxID=2219058 RepID=UPI000E651861|nr:hypothetical protein [Facilibium subflavum]
MFKFKRTRKLIKNSFDFKGVVNQQKVILQHFKKMFSLSKPKYTHSFEQLDDIGIDKLKLANLVQRFSLLYRFFFFGGIAMLTYALCLLAYGYIWAFLLSVSLTFVFLSHAFKFHYWVVQIKKHKLGCSIKEWWQYLLGGQ